MEEIGNVLTRKWGQKLQDWKKRRDEMLQKKLNGATYEQIAQEYGIRRDTAITLIRKASRDRHEETTQVPEA